MKNLFTILFLFLCSCSARFPVLDTVIDGWSVSRVERYFDLDVKQAQSFQQSMEADLNRLKKERLDEIAKSFRKTDQRMASAKNDPQILAEAYDSLSKEFTRSSGYFKNSAMRLTDILRNEQFEHFERRMKSDIASARKEPLSQKNEELLKKYTRQLDFWVGPLTGEQEHSLIAFVNTVSFPWNERLNNRESILNSFMAKRTDFGERREMSRQFMVDYDSLRTPEYAKAMDIYETQFKIYLNKFWISMTPEQKQHMQSRLQKQAEELDRLARN